jgi:hypothetical protein
VTPEEQNQCEALFSENRARSFQSQQKSLLNDGEIRRYWPDVDPDKFALAVEWLRQREYVDNPTVDGVSYDGTWRTASIEVRHDEDDSPRVVEILREGYALLLFDDECRCVSNKEFKDFEEVAVLQWKNLDPNKARVLRELILDRDFSAPASPADVEARAGTGALTVRGDEYGSGYEVATSELTWDEDGSGILTLILVKTNNEDLEFTVGLSCKRTMRIFYAYGLAKADLADWKQSRNLHQNETGKTKDFRVLRRNSDTGTFDVFGSETTYEEIPLAEHVSEVSAGRTVFTRSAQDAATIESIELASGEIIRLQARKNDKCLIDQSVDRVVPNDLPRTSGSDQQRKSSSGIEHFEASELDTAELENTSAAVNELIEWFWKKTDADNYAWSRRTITYQSLPLYAVQESAVSRRDSVGSKMAPDEPPFPGTPNVGQLVEMRKATNELGSWDWERSIYTAKPLDSTDFEIPTSNGTVYLRVLRNVTRDKVQEYLDVWRAQSAFYNVEARPRYNDDETMDVTIIARPVQWEVDIDPHLDRTVGPLKSDGFLHTHLYTRSLRRATNFAKKSEEAHSNGMQAGVVSIGGGVFKATTIKRETGS